jgi:hypothetical protein
MRRTVVLAAILAAAWAAVAAADGGGPSPGVDQGDYGILSPDGKLRYLAIPAWNRTFAEAVTTRGAHVVRMTFLRGAFGIPFVAVDGTTGGLARNGNRLVLGQAPYGRQPPDYSRFVVLDRPQFPRSGTPAAEGLLGLRRDLAQRVADVPDPIPRGAELMSLRRACAQPEYGTPLPGRDRRPAQARREDDGPAGDAGREPRRLGLHALRPHRKRPVRARARHRPQEGVLRRPALARDERVAVAGASAAEGRRPAATPRREGGSRGWTRRRWR